MMQYISKPLKIITGIMLAFLAVSLVSCVVSILLGHGSDKIIRFSFEWYVTMAPLMVAILLLPIFLWTAFWNSEWMEK